MDCMRGYGYWANGSDKRWICSVSYPESKGGFGRLPWCLHHVVTHLDPFIPTNEALPALTSETNEAQSSSVGESTYAPIVEAEATDDVEQNAGTDLTRQDSVRSEEPISTEFVDDVRHIADMTQKYTRSEPDDESPGGSMKQCRGSLHAWYDRGHP
jgi:hypothetical protein